MTDVTEGQKAPEFSLPTDDGATIALNELTGKKVVLYFYPKDDTSGCTKQALQFTELKGQFEAENAVIVGVSPDPVKKHVKFKQKHDLTITLAADEEKKTIQDYGVWIEKSMYGRKYMGVDRSTFLIAPDGKVAKVWRKVKVPGHAEAVLKEVSAL